MLKIYNFTFESVSKAFSFNENYMKGTLKSFTLSSHKTSESFLSYREFQYNSLILLQFYSIIFSVVTLRSLVRKRDLKIFRRYDIF